MARRSQQPVVLAVAGFDPSSGAGVTADIQTLAANGCFGVACITALTVQSTAGVRQVFPLPAKLVTRTLKELAADLPIAAVKIGMLGSGDVARAVAGFLRRHPIRHVVLDPILKSSSGAALVDRAGVREIAAKLLPLCTVVTPNLKEAAALTGLRVTTAADMHRAARRLHDMGAPAVVITGGHLGQPLDLVSASVGRKGEPVMAVMEILGRRVQSRSTHGTGCAFSSALAANLATGMDLFEAARAAKQYVSRAIETATPRGRGDGPLNLLWPMR